MLLVTKLLHYQLVITLSMVTIIMLVVSITLLRIISLSIIVIFCSHLDCGKLKHLLYLPDIFR